MNLQNNKVIFDQESLSPAHYALKTSLEGDDQFLKAFEQSLRRATLNQKQYLPRWTSFL